MRYEHGPGHVRAGRLAAELRRAGRDGDPLIDGATLSLEAFDLDHARLLRMADALSTTSEEGADAAWAILHATRRRETFPGVALRLPRRWRLVVGVAGTRPVNPARWLRRDFLAARARWLLEGRPPPVPVTPSGHDLERARPTFECVKCGPVPIPVGVTTRRAMVGHGETVHPEDGPFEFTDEQLGRNVQEGPAGCPDSSVTAWGEQLLRSDPTNRVRPLWPGWPGPDRGPTGG